MKANANWSQLGNPWLIIARALFVSLLLTPFAVSRLALAEVADCNAVGGSFSPGPEPECAITSSQTLSGSFTINSKLRLASSGSITVPPASGGSNALTLGVSGDFLMESGSTISGNVTSTSGVGAHIIIDAAGNISMQGNTLISSAQIAGSCTGGKGGFIELFAEENISIASGAEIRVDAECSAGEIVLDAGVDTFIDGLVSSYSTLSGVGANQPPGGGPITIKAGCNAKIEDNAIVSSRGEDPGADRVHIEGGCNVHIFGLVESSGPGHAILPNSPINRCRGLTRPDKPITSTACVEIWAGNKLEINSLLPHKGEIKADIAGGSDSLSWIDLFVRGPLVIEGDNTAPYAVHANQAVTNTFGGLITLKSTESTVTMKKLAVQANATNGGGTGGEVTIEASQSVSLSSGTDGAFIEAKGAISGGTPHGGKINLRSFNATITGAINSKLDALGGNPLNGVITVQGCGTSTPNDGVVYTGTVIPPLITKNDACGGAPALPPYIALPLCGCLPGISIDKACIAVIDPTGAKVRVNFSGKVTNTGSVNLTEVQITDITQPDIPGLVFDELPPSPLLKQQSADYKGHYFVTPQGGALDFSDTVTATAKYLGTTITSQPATASCKLSVEPLISVTKECKNSPVSFPKPIQFGGEVCNKGPEQLISVTVTDSPVADPAIPSIGTLNPGQCTNYNGSYVPTQVGLQQKDIVTAEGKGKLSDKIARATASAFCDVVGPDMEVTKHCSSAVSSDGKNILVTVNGTIKNTGGVSLTITKITDNPPATLTPEKTNIAPNETIKFSGSYTQSSTSVSDTVTVEAKDANNNTVSKDASAQCSLDITPSVTIDEQCTNPNTPLGSPLEFSGKVCNTGQEELKNLVISDEKGSTITPNDFSLAPPPFGGQSCVTYTGKYTPTGTGPQTNNVRVDGKGAVSGRPANATSSATCTVSSQPAISVTKDCSCVIDSTGTSASVQFSGKVCNDGNENLSNVQIIDDKPNSNTVVKTISSLLPGAANCVSYSGSYPTTALANSDTVTAIGFGASSGIKVTAQDDAACGCSASPDITVTTACSPSVAPVGSPLSFTGKVCSTGNVALGNVTVVSDRPKANTKIALSKTTLSALAAGQTPGDAQCVTYSGQYKPNGSGSFSHTITAIGQSLLGNVADQASVAATCVLGQSCFPADWVGLADTNGWIGYNPNKNVSTVFSIPSSLSSLGNLTLLRAVTGGNGRGSAVQKAAATLIKEAMAGLLNAAHPQVNYPIENTATIIAQVNTALASGNIVEIKKLATTFSLYNKLGGAPAVCQATPPPC